MERLTIRNSDGSVSQPTATTIAAVFQRLAAYEDTGMTPEQIRNAQDTLQCFDNIGIKRGNEIVKAEEDGRLVVLDEALRPLVWGDADHDTILCPRCLNDLMGGFDFAPDADTKMFQCPYCGCPVDPTRVDPFAEDADVLTNEAVTDINVGNKPVNDLYDEDGGDIYE